MLEQRLEQLLHAAIRSLGWPEVAVAIAPPKQREHGDLSTNVAFLLAREIRQSPRDVAQRLVSKLQPYPAWLEQTEVAGAGFINFRVRETAFFEMLADVLRQGKKYGQSRQGAGKKVLIEFVSANPTGPLNIVSARAAAVGDAIANLLSATGHKVHREFYVNDIGNQIDLFGRSLEARYLQALGREAAVPAEGYQGEYLKEFGAVLAHKNKRYTLKQLQRIGLKQMIAWQQKSLKNFGVVFDKWFSQAALMKSGAIEKSIKKLRAAGHLYESEGALFFRATPFGDDKDRVVRKADGAYAYFASDIAYHTNKFERGFKRVIDLFGPDHHGYLARTRAAVGACGHDPEALTILIVQQVNLMAGEVLVKMSKRAGRLITMDDLIAEVGRDVARYFFLQRAASTPLDFDLELAKKETPENPVFYIQYAHARIAGIFRKAKEAGLRPRLKKIDFAQLDLPEEKALCQRVLAFPGLVTHAAGELTPHTVAFYALDITRQFQAYYSQAKHDARYKVVNPEQVERTQAKLYLLKNIQIVLQNALKILGISAPDRMEKDAAAAI